MSIVSAWKRTILSTYFISGASVVTSVIIARWLGAEGRGALAYYLTIASLSAGLSQFGLAYAASYDAKNQPYTPLGLFIAVGTGISALGSAGFCWIIQQIDPSNLGNSIPVMVLASLNAVFLFGITLLQVQSTLVLSNQIKIIYSLLTAVCASSVLAVSADPNIQNYLTLMAGCYAIASIALFLRIRTISPYQDRLSISLAHKSTVSTSTLQKAWGYYVSTLTGLAIVNVDKLILSNTERLEQLGVYVVAYTLSRQAIVVQESLAAALFAANKGSGDHETANRIKNNFTRTFLPLLIMAAALSPLIGELIPLIYGKQYDGSKLLFMILCIEGTVGSSSWILAQRFLADGRTIIVAIRQLLSALPLFSCILFLPDSDQAAYLCWMMLLGSVIRLAFTLLAYPTLLGERMPALIPTTAMIKSLLSRFIGR